MLKKTDGLLLIDLMMDGMNEELFFLKKMILETEILYMESGLIEKSKNGCGEFL